MEDGLEIKDVMVGDEAARAKTLYFLKHRLGVKGRAVTPLRGDELLAWLDKSAEQCRSRGGEFGG